MLTIEISELHARLGSARTLHEDAPTPDALTTSVWIQGDLHYSL
jgi:hypothetical protein